MFTVKSAHRAAVEACLNHKDPSWKDIWKSEFMKGGSCPFGRSQWMFSHQGAAWEEFLGILTVSSFFVKKIHLSVERTFTCALSFTSIWWLRLEHQVLQSVYDPMLSSEDQPILLFGVSSWIHPQVILSGIWSHVREFKAANTCTDQDTEIGEFG